LKGEDAMRTGILLLFTKDIDLKGESLGILLGLQGGEKIKNSWGKMRSEIC